LRGFSSSGEDGSLASGAPWSEEVLDELDSDIVSPQQRRWEEFYRNRLQYDKPKILVSRSAVPMSLFPKPEPLLAIVSNRTVPLDVPQFGFAEVDSIVGLIVECGIASAAAIGVPGKTGPP